MIRKIRNEMVTLPLNVSSEERHRFFFGGATSAAELATRQFVIDRHGNSINHAFFGLLGGDESVTTALPREWRSYLTLQGWKIHRWRSALAWQATIAARLAHGIAQGMRLVWQAWRSATPEPGDAARVAAVAAVPHVAFESLTAANLPNREGIGSGDDICSFYARWDGRMSAIGRITHDVKGTPDLDLEGIQVHYQEPVWAPAGRAAALKLSAWLVRAALLATGQALIGRWHYALLLAEAAKARAVTLCAPDRLALDYLFHCSRTIYRPLWTYEAQQRGSQITLYFYSTFDQPKLASGYEKQLFEWGPANWPRYIVWDDWQQSILHRDLGDDLNIIKVGPVTFSDNAVALAQLPARPIAVFNIQPHRRAAHLGISTLCDCMAAHPDFYVLFLEDVAEVIAELDGHAVLKGKRNIGHRGDRRYRDALAALTERQLVHLVDPGISAVRVISQCLASISVPFTSTALYGRELGIPSAYYDPTGWMQQDDGGTHGIVLLQGKAQLRAWLKECLVPETSEKSTQQEAPC